jgi:hypothetical protein
MEHKKLIQILFYTSAYVQQTDPEEQDPEDDHHYADEYDNDDFAPADFQTDADRFYWCDDTEMFEFSSRMDPEVDDEICVPDEATDPWKD